MELTFSPFAQHSSAHNVSVKELVVFRGAVCRLLLLLLSTVQGNGKGVIDRDTSAFFFA